MIRDIPTSLESFGERVEQCSAIVFRRLTELVPLETKPLVSNDAVRVWSLGAAKNQASSAAHRLIARTVLLFPESVDTNRLGGIIHDAFVANRIAWDSSRSTVSRTLRTVAATAAAFSKFECNVVRAATNSLCGGLVSPREFLCVETSWVNKEKGFCCGFSLDETIDKEAKLDPPSGFVRGIAHPSGWYFDSLGNNRYSFTYTIHAEPGGLLPPALVNESSPQEVLRLMTNFGVYMGRLYGAIASCQ